MKLLIVLILVFAQAQAQAQIEGRPGIAIDARGGAVIDPTENVKALNESANKRQDDLRAAFELYVNARLEAINKESLLRFEMVQQLSLQQDRRIDEVAKLRAEYAERLGVAEAKRIDAIRAVDVNAVAVASTRATDQASVLATQVSQSAEALRALVATTANTVAQSQQQLANTLSARLTTLEQASYQQAGTAKVQDPALAALVAEVRALSQSRAAIAGTSEGYASFIGWIMGGLGLLAALVTAVLAFTRRQPAAP